MGSPNGSNDTPHIPLPLSFYNTFQDVFSYLFILTSPSSCLFFILLPLFILPSHSSRRSHPSLFSYPTLASHPIFLSFLPALLIRLSPHILPSLLILFSLFFFSTNPSCSSIISPIPSYFSCHHHFSGTHCDSCLAHMLS
jgi:hypothetical protein